jgi:hypothetical protein
LREEAVVVLELLLVLYKCCLHLRLHFLLSSLFLVVVVQVTILALSFGIYESVSMRAVSGITVSSILVITMIAHALCIMLLVFVRAFHDFHSFSLFFNIDLLIVSFLFELSSFLYFTVHIQSRRGGLR